MPSVNNGNVMQDYTIINSMIAQETGRTDLQATDASTFTAMMHTIPGLGKDRFNGTLTQEIAETRVHSPKAKSEFESILVDASRWGELRRTIYCADLDIKSDPQFSVAEGDTAGSWEVENLGNVYELGYVGKTVDRIPLTHRYSEYEDAVRNIEGFNKIAGLKTTMMNNAITRSKDNTGRAAVLGLMSTLIADVANHPERVVDITDKYCLKKGYLDGNGQPNKTYADIVALGEEKEFWQEYANQQAIALIDIEADNILYKNNLTGKEFSESVPESSVKGFMLAAYKTEIQTIVRPMIRDNDEFKYIDLPAVSRWQAYNYASNTHFGGARDAINWKGLVPDEATGNLTVMDSAVEASGIISVMFADNAAFGNLYPTVTMTSPWDLDKLAQKTTTHLTKLPVVNPYAKAVLFKLH